MVMTLERDRRELVAPREQDVGSIRELDVFLREQAHRPVKLVAPDGEQIDIPAPIYEVLRLIAPLMAEGAAIGLAPLYQELTTQQAADLLNISRPSLIKLLDTGDIPHHKISSFRCIRRLGQAEQRLLGPHAAAVGPRSRWVDGRCGPFLCEYGPEVGSHAERACA